MVIITGENSPVLQFWKPIEIRFASHFACVCITIKINKIKKLVWEKIESLFKFHL